jgi:hypothetical protein
MGPLRARKASRTEGCMFSPSHGCHFRVFLKLTCRVSQANVKASASDIATKYIDGYNDQWRTDNAHRLAEWAASRTGTPLAVDTSDADIGMDNAEQPASSPGYHKNKSVNVGRKHKAKAAYNYWNKVEKQVTPSFSVSLPCCPRLISFSCSASNRYLLHAARLV